MNGCILSLRTIGHSVDEALLRRDHAFWSESQGRRAGLLADKTDPVFFRGFVDNAIRLARLEFVLEAPVAGIRESVKQALPQLRRCHELGGVLDPIAMRVYLGAALWVCDTESVRWLSSLPRQAWTNPQLEVSEAAYRLVEAAQAHRDRAAFAEAVRGFRTSLADLTVSPRSEKAVYAPLAALLEAVADGRGYDAAWKAQGVAWTRRFSRASEAANVDGLVDVEALGIARVAESFGLPPPHGHPYAPPELLA